MLARVLILGALPFAVASEWQKGSSFAGSTSTAAFPPAPTNPADAAYFPDASQVGYAGPTPTGDEPEVIATAPVAAQKTDTYPLTQPQVLFGTKEEVSSSFNPMRYWANLSPWFSVDSAANGLPGASPQVPNGCEITQVHMVQRHGARYPASGDPPSTFATALNEAASSTGFSVSGPLEFLNDWTYKLGAELLTPFGRQQLFDLGVSFRIKYGGLLKNFKSYPVFRTTSEARMVDSAVSFAAGFFGLQDYQSSYELSIEIEESNFNSTLAPWNNCANANGPLFNLGYTASDQWNAIYLKDAVKRLQQYIKGVELTTDVVYAMQNLCAFETVALGYSDFCGLFTEEEWKGFEYSIDLIFWYSDGPGNPVTAAQGIGYVQELVARLTNTPITKFDTNTNSTLDGNNVTFPLNQPIYFDFTHDTVIAAYATAMNFTSFAAGGPLPATHIPAGHTYLTQHIAPFAANMIGQVLECPESSKSSKKVSYMRWLLNDGVVPLTGISHCAEHPNKDGLCPLDSFIAGMQDLIAAENWSFDCNGNYTVGVPNNIVDGKYHPQPTQSGKNGKD
ncbi:hypothetical protein NM688_g871 [Phlebia brevispora]|uniref:Uncharacterized protein n=1 Tax=Phlebia brevispora TaxID=194682 RepID=A0ACC1TCS9_9APHY|nr:hypothetical protein NM688_g871 [Phlebia brevispora]